MFDAFDFNDGVPEEVGIGQKSELSQFFLGVADLELGRAIFSGDETGGLEKRGIAGVVGLAKDDSGPE